MSRRKTSLLLVSLSFAFLQFSISTSLADSGVSASNPIKETVQVFGEALKATTQLKDLVKDLIPLGFKVSDDIKARQTATRLRDISARLTVLSATQNRAVVAEIDEYLTRKPPKPEDWSRITTRLDHVLHTVDSIFNDLKKERSDLVLDPAYSRLINTLHGRSGLLQRLVGMPPPTSSAELQDLREINEKYKQLVENLRTTTVQLNEYLAKK